MVKLHREGMPVYEYICAKCGKKFMEVLRISELNKKKLAVRNAGAWNCASALSRSSR
jgi:putative FmdB family regulatory protein